MVTFRKAKKFLSF